MLRGVWVQEGCSGTGIPKGRPALKEGFSGEWAQKGCFGAVRQEGYITGTENAGLGYRRRLGGRYAAGMSGMKVGMQRGCSGCRWGTHNDALCVCVCVCAFPWCLQSSANLPLQGSSLPQGAGTNYVQAFTQGNRLGEWNILGCSHPTGPKRFRAHFVTGAVKFTTVSVCHDLAWPSWCLD